MRFICLYTGNSVIDYLIWIFSRVRSQKLVKESRYPVTWAAISDGNTKCISRTTLDDSAKELNDSAEVCMY